MRLASGGPPEVGVVGAVGEVIEAADFVAVKAAVDRGADRDAFSRAGGVALLAD